MSVDWLGEWLRARAVAEGAHVMHCWFEAREGWPPEQLLAALAQELPSVQARATCRVVAAAVAQLSGEGAVAVMKRLDYHRPSAAVQPRGRVWLGTPSAYTCSCELPVHARGTVGCQWDDVRGWRPRPVREEQGK